MESSGSLRKARKSICGFFRFLWEQYISESCSNYKPRETEVIIDISNDIKLYKVKCIYTDDKSVAWEKWQDDDGNEWVKRVDVEDY